LSKIDGPLLAGAAARAGPLAALFGNGLKHFGQGLLSSPGGRTHLKPHVGHSIRVPPFPLDAGDFVTFAGDLAGAAAAGAAAGDSWAGAAAAGFGDAAGFFGAAATRVGDGEPAKPFGNGLKHLGHGLPSSPAGRDHLKPHVGNSILVPTAFFVPIDNAGFFADI